MYSVGVFYAWDFLAILIVTVTYLLCPSSIIEKKDEYVKFFLLSLSVLFLLFIVITNIICNDGMTHFLFKVSIIPFLFLTHLIYPFKSVRRSQHLNFFLFFLSIYVIGVNSLMILTVALSNM